MKEKKDIKKTLKFVWLAYSIFSILIVIYLVDMLICKDIMNVSNRLVLNDHWNVTINDKAYNDISLDTIVFETVTKGDKIVMETVLPKEWQYKEAVLCLHNRHTSLDMYVNDVLEYSYGQERVEKKKATGSGYLLINFYEEYKGKNLRLEYIVTENNAFSRLDEVFISEWGNSYRYLITQNRVPMLIGSFLIVFGVMMTMVLVFAVAISRKYSNVLYLSIFSLCIGIWTLCYYNVVIVFSIPLYSISLMEYMSLFIAPLPIMAYMYTFVKELNSKIVVRVYNVLFITQLVLTVTTIALHTTDTVHGAQILPEFQVMFVVEMLFAGYVLYRKVKENDTMRKLTVGGLMLVVLCILYELIRYSALRYTGHAIFEVKGIASAGFVVFIGILILDLYQRVTQSMMEEQEKAILIKLAYTDELTKLHNRTYCSEYMKKMDDNKQTYTVISFDLNGLKQANDTYGHAKGDELICSAAKVLDKAFSKAGVVGRMGGDEFIAIIENSDKNYIEELTKKFKEYMDEVNKENPGLNLSIAFGYAISEELVDEGIEKVYQLADDRMYECKRKSKLGCTCGSMA